MKKVLSLSLAFVMLMASVSTAFTAQAIDSLFLTKLESVKQAAANYIVSNDVYTDYGDVKNASALWTLIKAGQDMSSIKDTFTANVKVNLDKNSGKLVVEGLDWYEDFSKPEDSPERWYSVPYSYEDIAVYGAVVLILNEFGYNTKNFEGYDLESVLESFDLATVTNPYNYRVAIEAENDIINNPTRVQALLDDMTSRFYTMGSGINNWGYSCDNTAQMLLAIGSQTTTGDYSAYITDAKAIIKTYTLEQGAYADAYYVTDVNADSTALAMGGFAAAGDFTTARWYYGKLLENFYNSETGAFQTGGTDNMYATKDSLLGLIFLENEAKATDAYEKTNGHTPAAVAVIENEVAPTCKAAGSYDEVVYCTVCGDEISRETKPVSKIAHTPGQAVREKVIPASCLTDGSYDEVVYCTVCGDEISREAKVITKTGHTPGDVVRENKIDATCTTNGSYDEVTYCADCGEEILRESKVITKTGHTPDKAVRENVVAPTYKSDGSYNEVIYCKTCGKKLSSKAKVLKKLSKVSLAKATVKGIETKSYTGKAVEQSITVMLGKTLLKKGTDYKVAYKNNKNVGVATITITGVNKYTNSITKTFVIKPEATSINKAAAIKKGFAVSWKKRTAQTTGYQIQYSTSSKFAKAKTKTVAVKNTVTNKKFTKLAAKKKYYVRVRTYKRVGKKTYYSKWSAAKPVTTK